MLAGLIYGLSYQHIDHIAPLCSLLDLPLIVTEQDDFNTVGEYYPNTSCELASPTEMPFTVLSRVHGVITALPTQLIDLIFDVATQTLNKKFLSVWCPHGNSDKGWKAPFLEALSHEKIILYYGKTMKDFMSAKGISEIAHTFISIGDYRHQYFQKNLWFYREKFNELRKRGLQNLIYVPSWSDSEGSGSFVESFPDLVKSLPSNFSLYVKLHPNDHLRNDPGLMKLVVENEDQATFIDRIPPIYPVLENMDVYLGDRSSVNYDFLHFQKPMFLYNNHNSQMSKCVPVLDSWKCLPAALKKDQSLQYSKRARLYGDTFDSLGSIDEKKAQIMNYFQKHYERL